MVRTSSGMSSGGTCLPPGWKKHRSKETGREYYRNRDTGATQWDKPGGTGVAGPRAVSHERDPTSSSRPIEGSSRPDERKTLANPTKTHYATREGSAGTERFEDLLSSKSTKFDQSRRASGTSIYGPGGSSEEDDDDADDAAEASCLTSRLMEDVLSESDKRAVDRIVRSRMVTMTRQQRTELLDGLKFEVSFIPPSTAPSFARPMIHPARRFQKSPSFRHSLLSRVCVHGP